MQNVHDDGYGEGETIRVDDLTSNENTDENGNEFGLSMDDMTERVDDLDVNPNSGNEVRIRGGCGGGGGGCGGGGGGCGGGGGGCGGGRGGYGGGAGGEGGWSGGGGGGCGCGSARGRSNIHPDYANQSSSGTRYQMERSPTNEGGCGCSSGHSKGGIGGQSGGCCSSGGRYDKASYGTARNDGFLTTNSEKSNEGSCASKSIPTTGYEKCPPGPPDPCSPDPASHGACGTVACSSPCAGRKDCCPPAGCRPVKRRTARCNSPCTGDTQSCGGGGCCGGGCRGGCGKPGQICLPLRSCTIPPCQPHTRGRLSPCMPPRSNPPQPPCCRVPVLLGAANSVSAGGREGGSSCCRSASPKGRTAGGGGCGQQSGCQQPNDPSLGSCCQTKVPPGCECLGGGQDCQRCGRKVYHAEMQVISGVPYHNICFSCFCCRKPLETLTYHENCGEIYCKQCYVRNFGPQGYGYSGVLQTPM